VHYLVMMTTMKAAHRGHRHGHRRASATESDGFPAVLDAAKRREPRRQSQASADPIQAMGAIANGAT
jgi:hypothetical protein